MSKSKNDIIIRGLNDNTITQLDLIASKRNCSSRNELLCKIINEYVACNNDEMVEYLPKIVRSLCETEINLPHNRDIPV